MAPAALAIVVVVGAEMEDAAFGQADGGKGRVVGFVVPVFRRRDVDVPGRPLGPGERDTSCTTC